MKTALRIFALILSCLAAMSGKVLAQSSGKPHAPRTQGTLLITKIPIDDPRSVNPWGLAAAVAGANKIWFTDPAFSQVGSFTLDGVFTKFKLTDATSPSIHVAPLSIVEGRDGNAWFSAIFIDANGAPLNRDSIGKVTPAGMVSYFQLPTGNGCQGFFQLNNCAITNGPDGNLWVAESAQGKVAKVTLSGQVTEFQVRPPDSFGGLMGFVLAADGNFYAPDYNGSSIWKISPQGNATELKIPVLFPQPWGVTSGSDGNVWFTTRNGSVNSIGKLAPTGQLTLYPIPTPRALANQITTGPDGALWFTETGTSKIGQLVPSSGAITEFAVPNGENPENIISVGSQIVFNSTAGLTSTDFDLYRAIVAVPATPRLTVTKSTLYGEEFRAGDSVFFQIVVENTSDVDAAPGITVTDQAPQDTQISFARGYIVVAGDASCTNTKTSLSCSLNRILPAHQKMYVDMTVTTTKKGLISNTARVDGGGDPTNPKNSNTAESTEIDNRLVGPGALPIQASLSGRPR